MFFVRIGRRCIDIRALAKSFLQEGFSASRAAREVSSRLGIGKNAAYEIVLSLERDDEESS